MIEEEDFLENPSLLDLEKGLVKMRNKKEEKIYEGGMTRHYMFSSAKDRRHYVKFIVYPGWFEKIRDLSPSAVLMLFYILEKIGYAKSRVTLVRSEFCENIGISNPTFYVARDELVEKGWLIPVGGIKKDYFINLKRVVRGPVEAVYKDYEFRLQRRKNTAKIVEDK